jgi:phospholipid transport system transporter-binding protein
VIDAPSASASRGAFTAAGAGWRFEGALTLDDAAQVLEATRTMPLPEDGGIDFAGLTQADSSALAVIIALKRRGASEGRVLSIAALPDSLRSLAVVYGVDDLI